MKRNEFALKSLDSCQTVCFLYVGVAQKKPKTSNMAIKPKDLKFEEAALRKRLEFVKSIKTALKQEDSVTAQTVETYTSIIDGTCRKTRILHIFLAMLRCLDLPPDYIFSFYSLQKSSKKSPRRCIEPSRLAWYVFILKNSSQHQYTFFPCHRLSPPLPLHSLKLSLSILNTYRMIYMTLEHGNTQQHLNKKSTKQAKTQQQHQHYRHPSFLSEFK
jgi:hypothetical protein